MSVAARIALGLLPLWLTAGAPEGDAPERKAVLTPHGAVGEDTQCGACHTVTSWIQVVFPHERTGFPLHGAHERTACKTCHPVDFVQRVPDTCSGCHRDPHMGDLGARCVSCHDEATWKTLFTADAHRKTNFPLSGRSSLPAAPASAAACYSTVRQGQARHSLPRP